MIITKPTNYVEVVTGKALSNDCALPSPWS